MQTLEAEEPGDLDHCAILDRTKRVALTCARDISGVTGWYTTVHPQSLE